MGGRKIYFTPYNQDKVANPGSAWCGLVYIVFALALIIPQFAFAADLVPVQTAPGTSRALPAQPAAPAPAAPGPRQPETVPPPTPPPAPSTPPMRAGQMLFNFQDADIQAVVKTVSQISGRNFLLDPRVKGKITIISAKPVSANAAYQIFLSALKAQGFAAVEGPGGIVKILPEAEAKQNAAVSSTAQPGGGDRLITQVVVVQHGSATQMVPLLRPLMAPTGLLSVYAPANTLVITDYADNVRRLLQIIEKIDQPGSAEVTIIPLEYASALDMAQLLVRLSDVALPQSGQPVAVGQIGGDGGRLSIVPDLRTNSLLVRTDNQGRVNQLRVLVAKLDVPARRGGNTRVVYLRNAEAVKLAEILRGLLAGEARAQATPSGAIGGPVPVGAAARSATEASLIQSDEASNSLIISAPDAVYNNLRAVIEKLDIRRAQVFVEALIVEVSTDLAAQFGIQWAGAKGQGSGTIGGVQNFTLTGSGIINTAVNPTSLANSAGLTIAYVGKKITLPGGQEIVGLGALARALESDSNANVLSTPNLLTLDNAEAKIVVAQNVPFITGQFAQASGVAGATVNPFQTIERKDVGLTLKIKPQISEGEGIKLQIFEEVSDVVGVVSGAQDIVTNKRSLETTVIVDNGQTVVLGGLIQEKVTEGIQAVPILSSIPLLGELFKFRSRTKTKTNLMVFLRPIIVRSPQDSEGFTAERYEYIRSQQQNMQMDRMTVIPRYESPVLPPLVQPTNDQPKVKGKEEDVPGPPESDKAPDTTKP
jgi:general secretion pathway protein D